MSSGPSATESPDSSGDSEPLDTVDVQLAVNVLDRVLRLLKRLAEQ